MRASPLRYIIILVVPAWAACTSTHAQDASLVPEIRRELAAARDDTARADALARLCFNLIRTAPDSALAAGKKALEIATAHLDERMAHESELRDYVIDRVLKNIPEARLNGGRSPRLPNNVNISFPGLEGETILLDLDMHGICASTGSACNSDSLDPSHVLLSIGVPEEIGHGSMRFTFGPQNTMEEAKYLCDVLEEVIPRRRAMSCMWLQGQNTARQFSLKGEQ